MIPHPKSYGLFVILGLLLIEFTGVCMASRAEVSRIFPTQWWDEPHWSPDGSLLAITYPRPPITTHKQRGEIFYSHGVVPQQTFVLNAKDYSVKSKLDYHLFPSWSPNGRYLAGHGFKRIGDGECNGVFDSTTGRLTLKLAENSDLAWAPDSRAILAVGSSTVSVVAIPSGHAVKCQVNDYEDYLDHLAWAPDGRYVAAAGADIGDWNSQFIHIWDSQTGKQLHLVQPERCIEFMSWSPDGKYFLYSEPGTLHFLNSENMQPIREFHTADIEGVRWQFSPDGKKIAYIDDNYLYIRDMVTLQEKIKIAGRTSGFFWFSWSPDSKYLLLDDPTTLALCDASTGKYLGHRKFPKQVRAQWKPKSTSLVLVESLFAPSFVSLNLSSTNKLPVFPAGKQGSPGWERHASPRTLEECFVQFNRELTPTQRDIFKNTKESGIGKYGGGSFITDSMMSHVYAHWGRSALLKWFAERGVSDPRDVTDIVLVSYWRYLNGKPLNLEENISEHKAWWNRSRMLFHENRPAPNALLNLGVKSRDYKESSIRELPGVRVVCLLAERYDRNLIALKALQTVAALNHTKNVSIVAVVFNNQAVGVLHEKDASLSELASTPDQSKRNFFIAKGSKELWSSIDQFCDRASSGLPQTLVISGDGTLTARLNSGDVGDKRFERLLLRLIEKSSQNQAKPEEEGGRRSN